MSEFHQDPTIKMLLHDLGKKVRAIRRIKHKRFLNHMQGLDTRKEWVSQKTLLRVLRWKRRNLYVNLKAWREAWYVPLIDSIAVKREYM